jgi:hypothetical protein
MCPKGVHRVSASNISSYRNCLELLSSLICELLLSSASPVNLCAFFLHPGSFPQIFLIFTCYGGGLNRNNSSNVQTWSVRSAAIAGVLCFQRRLPSAISIFSASWGLTRLNHAKNRHKCITSGFKRLEKLIVFLISLLTPFLTVRLFSSI